MTAEQQPTPPAPTAGNPVLRAALIIYGTLFLLLATIPGSVVSWLQGLDSNPVQHAALRAAQAVQFVSDRTGLSAPYLHARAAFLGTVGED